MSRLTESGLPTDKWWRPAESPGRIICDLCPRECSLKSGDRGFCFVRQNIDGRMLLTTYGRSTGFCIDPIEKKPLNHFLPGTAVLSFGTAGCNLGCQFCQNWDISKSREVERLSELALPETIAEAARRTNCRSVAFTYNDPVIWAEYAIDTARACRAAGIKAVAVTAGYISPAAREEFFHPMDAANVDLKAFTEQFYQKITYSHLQPVLETLAWLRHESDVWFEITNLIIPQANDSPDELRQMCDWILQSVGSDVPLHFSAFHPDFRMLDRPRTSHETLLQAREIAQSVGLKFVYIGNVHDVRSQSTWCPSCNALLVERTGYTLGVYGLSGNHCGQCGTVIPGHFEQAPGTWGSRRQPIRISDFAEPSSKNVVMSSSSRGPILTSPRLTDIQRAAIHHAACEFILAEVAGRPGVLEDPSLAGAANEQVMGVFVTLKRDGQLRGCIGTLGQPMSVLSALEQAAPRAAVRDQRFPPVRPFELPSLHVDVTLLFGFETIQGDREDRIAQVVLGTHGLRIQLGERAGLLLPSVAPEQGWDAETLLENLCRKAGLPTHVWQNAEARLERFQGHMIDGPFDTSISGDGDTNIVLPCSLAQAHSLAAYARGNLLAMLRGAVTNCVLPADCSDGTVDGLAVQISTADAIALATFSHIQLRGGIPLQSTLTRLTETAARWLQQELQSPGSRVSTGDLRSLQLDLIVMGQPAIQGNPGHAVLKGLDTRSLVVMVTDLHRSAWCFHSGSTPEELLDKAVQTAGLEGNSDARVITFTACCTADRMVYASRLPQADARIRPAAVAGSFYPDDADALSRLVDECLASGDTVVPVSQKETWAAVMVPHAGLKYSGRVAASALQRIRIPESVIVIGPRHTSAGANLAIAPNELWQIPGTTLSSDVALTRLLAERIDQLQLDAAAHANEHSIEMELPLLARLSPRSKIVGITVSRLDLQQCLQVGRQLADVLSELPVRPLLVISSDMHHFGSEAINRTLDELALVAMESRDPEILHQQVRQHGITMCGVLPAVIVMEALRKLGLLNEVQRTGYTTSADVTGDTSRVVGYAGMLLGRVAN